MVFTVRVFNFLQKHIFVNFIRISYYCRNIHLSKILFCMINIYRKTALIEGISYLILLFIAMPLKYIFNISEAVKYFGWIHGVLFLVFMVILIATALKYKWNLVRVIIYTIGSVLPFVPFILDKKLKEEYSQS